MKLRKYTQGITLFVEPQMYHEVKQVSDTEQVSLSEIFRQMIAEYLERRRSNNAEKVNINN